MLPQNAAIQQQPFGASEQTKTTDGQTPCCRLL